ncbi:MAG: TMEM165/GDT1 family protein [Candidatus Baldrarchaeia archaeon]
MEELFSTLIVFLVVAIDELGDKTWLATLALVGKYRSSLHVFIGVFLALTATTVIGVCIGSIASIVADYTLLKKIGGVVFILMGLATLKSAISQKDKSTEGPPTRNDKGEVTTAASVIISSFIITFLSEIGDKTWISVLIFATFLHPLMVITGAVLAFATINGITAIAGKTLSEKIGERNIRILSAAIFITLGTLLVTGII